jgi:hypothetical protein
LDRGISLFLDFFRAKEKRADMIATLLGFVTAMLVAESLGPVLYELIFPNGGDQWPPILGAGAGLVLGLLVTSATLATLEMLRDERKPEKDSYQPKMDHDDYIPNQVAPQIREWVENAVDTGRLPPQALQYYNDKIAAVEKGLGDRRLP